MKTLAFLIVSREEWISPRGISCIAIIRMRKNMFGNSDGFVFNIRFVDRSSMFVEPVA